MFFSASCKSKNPRQKTDSGEEETISCAARGIGIVYNPNIMILQEAEEPSTRAQANIGSG